MDYDRHRDPFLMELKIVQKFLKKLRRKLIRMSKKVMEYNQGKNKVVFSFDSNLTKEVHADWDCDFS